MRKYRFVVAIDVPSMTLRDAYGKLNRFLSRNLPNGFEAHVTEEAYWPSGGKVLPNIMMEEEKRRRRNG